MARALSEGKISGLLGGVLAEEALDEEDSLLEGISGTEESLLEGVLGGAVDSGLVLLDDDLDREESLLEGALGGTVDSGLGLLDDDLDREESLLEGALGGAVSVEGAIRVGSFRSGLSGVFGGSAVRSKRVS